MRPTWADIDLDAIAHNVRVFRGLLGDSELCAVVKADAYGHGAVPVARGHLAGGGPGGRGGRTAGSRHRRADPGAV